MHLWLKEVPKDAKFPWKSIVSIALLDAGSPIVNEYNTKSLGVDDGLATKLFLSVWKRLRLIIKANPENATIVVYGWIVS